MLRKPLIRLLIASVAILVLAPAGGAQAYNPATQSHEGACARETTSVAQAVHDYVANGVLTDFAHLVGLHGSSHAMRAQLVVARIQRRVVTANHGCDGEGHWFAVGPRTLHTGERAGVRVPAKLRARLCLRAHRDCRRIVVKESVVFPITCWNPNFGHVSVVLYVHPRKPKHHVKPIKEAAPPAPTPPPAPAPVADPAATASQLACSAGSEAGDVVVTLADSSTATASASFVVNGQSYGPLAPGATLPVKIAITARTGLKVTVESGGKVLIEESFTNGCVAKPKAIALPYEHCGTGEVELINEASATMPASFKIEWTGVGGMKSATYGPLAPGEKKTVSLEYGEGEGIELSGAEFPQWQYTVTSEGVLLLQEHVTEGC